MERRKLRAKKTFARVSDNAEARQAPETQKNEGIITWRNVLTWILDGGDNETEAVRDGAPRVGDVFQCHEVRARINRAHGLLRVLAGQVCLENKRNASR